MYIKSTWTLKKLLRLIYEDARDDEVATDVKSAMDYSHQIPSSRGNRKLLSLIKDAASTAEINGEINSRQALQDAYDYAVGGILENDICEKYDVYPGEGQISTKRLTDLFKSHLVLKEEIYDYIDKNPTMTAESLKRFMDSRLKRQLRFVEGRRAGFYGAFHYPTEQWAWLLDVFQDRIELSDLSISEIDPGVSALNQLPEAVVVAVQIQRRLLELDAIEKIVDNKFTREAGFQKVLGRNTWIFGGSYIDIDARRLLSAGVSLDIPLLRPDGVLHAVELKKAVVPLVKRHRSFLAATSDVNDAISQVENYLRSLDENRMQILEDHNIDVRRSRGMVVIGHPQYQPEYSETLINETLRSRTYYGRVDVITYKELLDNARRQLILERDLAGREIR